MKRTLLSAVVLLISLTAWAERKEVITSPDKHLEVSLRFADKIYYSLSLNNELLLKDCYLQLDLENESLGKNPKLTKTKRSAVNEEITPVIPLKNSRVKNNYNSILLQFKGDYSVEFRVFDDGVAYRFLTQKKNEVVVMNEDFAVNFPSDYLAHLSKVSSFKTAYEEPYSHVEAKDFGKENLTTTLPVLIDTRRHNSKILIAETNVLDYPRMFLKGTEANKMTSAFPKYPLDVADDGDRSQKILKEANYIAKTKGQRGFPWRYFVVTKNDGQLLENLMSCRLSEHSVLSETAWIKPGQVSWEWWNDASPYGPDVNFESGYNLDTYKYYIDFASKYGIKYIIMDEGWAMNTKDPYTPNPKVNVHELIRYGKEKNVGIVLWLTWLTVQNNFDLFKTFGEWGVKGVKIDFMDRSDQWMVNYYERVAKEAARYKLFVDFHGSFTPGGLEYKYPNVLSYEGVRGLEQGGGCFPDNTIYLPFLRNAVGPMDFTPGAMINMQPNSYSAQRPNNAGLGTRANQMAMFVVFESGLQMLADNPSLYYRNAECTEFITQVPTTWDETVVLDAKVGEYVVVAKRKADKWFIGAMTNGENRKIEVDLSFLKSGKDYNMTMFEDGINASRQAMDYRKKTEQVKSGDKLKINMARNGGFAAMLN